MNLESKLVSDGTITSPIGFVAGAIHAGIKKEYALDLGILFSEVPCVAVGLFTTNKIKAAPVVLSQKHLIKRRIQAIVVNSGCANACTWEQGAADALEMAASTAKKMRVPPEEVLVASTGVIGTFLPMNKTMAGIKKIAFSKWGGHELARAILTTDTTAKEIALTFELDGHSIIIGGIAKGAGMIYPNLATMLCFLATDADIDEDLLQTALHRAVDDSFNMIAVDHDMSPNDTVALLANGLANNKPIKANTPAAQMFQSALSEVCISLAKQIAGDGEGATKLIEVVVEGAMSIADARIAARAIVASPLVKAAIHGSSPNWGRIITALGQSEVELVGSKIDLYLGDLCLVKAGRPLQVDRKKAKEKLSTTEVFIRMNLNLGNRSAIAWGCDLSEEYVTVNSAYIT